MTQKLERERADQLRDLGTLKENPSSRVSAFPADVLWGAPYNHLSLGLRDSLASGDAY